MDQTPREHVVSSIEALEQLYAAPAAASIVKEIDYLHPLYRKFIEAAPFAVLATGGPEGFDASPRGDPAGFIVVEDEKTLLIPDRRGNNRIDSLRNLVRDPRCALLFFVPGVSETLRVNGRATITIKPELLERFAFERKLPRSVICVHVERVYFQCSRAIMRSQLWAVETQIDRSSLPSIGTILEDLSRAQIDGEKYDRELPDRLKSTLY